MSEKPHVQIELGDCRDLIAVMPTESVDSIVTDPPYELGIMGKKWDASGIAYNVALWQECLRVLKPGGHMLSFGGTRTYHRMTCAIEDAGFEIRDCIVWVYSSGFPKSHNVSKSIDKAAGATREVIGTKKLGGNAAQSTKEKGGTYAVNTNSVGVAPINVPITAPATEAAKQWDGWGTALKPANEPIVVARKPLVGTVANSVQQYGTGAMNIDATRIGERWPANVIDNEQMQEDWVKYFFTPKASRAERNAGLEVSNTHPTVKPLALMRYLVRLVTPPNGTVLEPFAGSGTTLVAAVLEGFNAIGCELTAEYLPIIEGRVQWARDQLHNEPSTLFGDINE